MQSCGGAAMFSRNMLRCGCCMLLIGTDSRTGVASPCPAKNNNDDSLYNILLGPLRCPEVVHHFSLKFCGSF